MEPWPRNTAPRSISTGSRHASDWNQHSMKRIPSRSPTSSIVDTERNSVILDSKQIRVTLSKRRRDSSTSALSTGSGPTRSSSADLSQREFFRTPSPSGCKPVLPNPEHLLNDLRRRYPSLPEINRIPPFWEAWVKKIAENVYIGGIEAAYNAHVLCKLNIEFIVDLSNVLPHDVPRHKKSDVPCLCPRETPHSRSMMTISVPEDSTQDITIYFADMNRFIDRAINAKKGVLIHSFNGINRCAVGAIQFLMHNRKICLAAAEAEINGLLPKMRISSNYMLGLQKWERMLRSPNMVVGQTKSAPTPSLAKRRSAWD